MAIVNFNREELKRRVEQLASENVFIGTSLPRWINSWGSFPPPGRMELKCEIGLG
jgi:hypothetical protein